MTRVVLVGFEFYAGKKAKELVLRFTKRIDLQVYGFVVLFIKIRLSEKFLLTMIFLNAIVA